MRQVPDASNQVRLSEELARASSADWELAQTLETAVQIAADSAADDE